MTITGLNAVTTYRFQVFAENGVSLLAGRFEYVDITVTTEATVPSLVSNVRITNVKSSELSISWDAPVTELGDSDLVERYEGTFLLRKSVILFLDCFILCGSNINPVNRIRFHDHSRCKPKI